MIHETRSIEDVIDFLNDLLLIDGDALSRLAETRVPCSEVLAEHPTVQVTDYNTDTPRVGLLGILNGLFGADERGWGPISMIVEEDGRVSGFKRTAPPGAQGA